MRRFAPIAVLSILSAGMAGCDSLSDTLGPEGSFRVHHAVPDLYQANVYVRDIFQNTLSYGDVIFNRVAAADSYTFRIRTPQANGVSVEALEFTVPIEANVISNFILTGDAGNVTELTWMQPEGQVAYGHAAAAAGSFDIYLEAPGADLGAATPKATLSYTEDEVVAPPAAGSYQLTLTAPGAPGAIVFASAPFSLSGDESPAFVVLDSAGSSTSPVLVRVLGASSFRFLENTAAAPTIRAIHSSIETAAVDVDIEDDQMAVTSIAQDLDFTDVSAYADVSSGDNTLRFTDALNAGALIAEADIAPVNGTLYTSYLVGKAPDQRSVTVIDGNRRLANFAQLRIFQGAANSSFMDVYLVPAGADFTLYFPWFVDFPLAGDTNYQVRSPGTFDIVYTVANSSTVLARQDGVTLSAFGIYTIFLADTVDPNVLQPISTGDAL